MTSSDPNDPNAWEQAAAIAKTASPGALTKRSATLPFFFQAADGTGVLVHQGKLVTERGPATAGAYLRDLGLIRGEGPAIDDVLPVLAALDALPDVGKVDNRSYVNDPATAKLADLNPRIETDGQTAKVVLHYLASGGPSVTIDNDPTHKTVKGAPAPPGTKQPVARPVTRMSLTIPTSGAAAWTREDLNWADFGG